MPRPHLRGKLLGIMLLTTLVALVTALGAMIAYDLQAYHRGWVNDVNAQAELLGRTTAPALNFDDARAAQENLGLLHYQPKVRAAAIYNARGAVFASYVANGEHLAFPALPVAEGEITVGTDLVVFRRIVDKGQILGTVYLRTDYELYAHLRGYVSIALTVAVAAMLVAWLMSLWLQRIVTQPILLIGETAREVVAQRDYSRRVEKRSEDELGALADAFNAMMAEIERRTDALEASNRDKAGEVEERRLAQNQVMRLNEELESRVSERTVELERSNQDLALASAAAEEANRAKSKFLSNMSHELRTPLNAILGFGQLLDQNNGSGMTPEKHHAFVDHIVQAGHHLLALINDILNFAQIEAGQLSLSLEPVPLDDVLDECGTMMEPIATKRDVHLLMPSSAKLIVQADRTRLRQVLLNLLSNAIKYNHEHGSVFVHCRRIETDRVRVTVQDTGIGLNPEQLSALFQPFNRLGQEAGIHEGTGIGLVVTKHLVELMGGQMGVTSEKGTGSAFWIEMRASAVGENALTPSDAILLATTEVPGSANPMEPTACTVLCVDDNPASVRLIQEALASRKDVRLLVAGNGKLGVSMARQYMPDVILMDNNMPLMTGVAAQALLSKDPATAHIPIIATSANAMREAIENALAAGFFHYLTKPIQLDELMTVMDCAIETGRQRRR
jgi:signal transduction histidine kinase/CheY-like chemotaxis protein